MHVLQEYEELIASLPAYGIRGAYTTRQALGHRLEKPVAGQMPQGIVDVFEAIQIEEKHSSQSAISLSKGDGLANAVAKKQSIGQTGQGVMFGKMSHQLRLRPRNADVAKDDNSARDLSFTVVDGGYGVLDENFMSVAVDEDTVRRQFSGPVL
jgi:hypothetical protein